MSRSRKRRRLAGAALEAYRRAKRRAAAALAAKKIKTRRAPMPKSGRRRLAGAALAAYNAKRARGRSSRKSGRSSNPGPSRALGGFLALPNRAMVGQALWGAAGFTTATLVAGRLANLKSEGLRRFFGTEWGQIAAKAGVGLVAMPLSRVLGRGGATAFGAGALTAAGVDVVAIVLRSTNLLKAIGISGYIDPAELDGLAAMDQDVSAMLAEGGDVAGYIPAGVNGYVDPSALSAAAA